MSPLTEPTRIILRNGWQPMDPDAAAYIAAVETADGQALEEPVKIAIDNFVLGCKEDGIWDAIKASCILAGARTLNGALVPLAGAAPTNYDFVSGDYNRKTGLVGDGSTKYLDSNRNNNADPQNNKHIAAYATFASSTTSAVFLATNSESWIAHDANALYFRLNAAASPFVTSGTRTGFFGSSRSSSTHIQYRQNQTSGTAASASISPTTQSHTVYRQPSGANASSARIAFYSIGESLDLALLDARVTDLINKFAEVIP